MPYTMVQHSAFVANNDRRFARSVELRSVSAGAARKILSLGGLVTEEYADASDLEFRINYPPGVHGMIPACRGKFAKVKVEGQRLYLPTREELAWVLERQSERRLGGGPK